MNNDYDPNERSSERSKELIEEVLSKGQLSKKAAADILGISPNNFHNKFTNSTLKLDDFLHLLDVADLEIEVKDKPLFQIEDYNQLINIMTLLHKKLRKQEEITKEILHRLDVDNEEK